MTAAQIKNAKAEFKKLDKGGLRPKKITKTQAVKLIKLFKPTNLEEFKKIGFKFETIRSGVFRTCHKFKGLNLVIKVPKQSSGYYDGSEHSRNEIAAVAHLKTEKAVKRYLPEILYHTKDGEVIVMPFYHFGFSEREIVAGFFHDLLYDLGYNGGDMHYQNVAKTDDDGYVIGDLGYWDNDSWE